MRQNDESIDIQISDQSSLYDLHTNIKIECYKDVYKIKRSSALTKDFIPPQYKNQLSCVIRDIIVVDKQNRFLAIPSDPKISIEAYMRKNPDYFINKRGKYNIYIMDEQSVQNYEKSKRNTKDAKIVTTMKENLKKYLACVY